MWPAGFWPPAGVKTLQNTRRKVTTARTAGRAEPMTAKIRRTSPYKVLQSLCQKGFAISTRGRPTIFKPEAPSKVKGRVIDHLEDTFAKLDMLHEVLRSKGEPQLVYTIVSKPRVLE